MLWILGRWDVEGILQILHDQVPGVLVNSFFVSLGADLLYHHKQCYKKKNQEEPKNQIRRAHVDKVKPV